ncbi:MAG: fibronectin type III-like domain-contianing protein, partial [Pyrinomonadaceae bacterium]|nr:fibronectin type III-like domain-contianing protein [Pyrinomonadaceae bacterium]
LSYTSFRFSDLQLDKARIKPTENVTVSFSVENTGKRDGDEVAQLYIRDVAASVTRPVRELKGFERVTLKAGEKRRVSFVLKPEHFGFLDGNMKFNVEAGEFQVFVNGGNGSGLESKFEVVR